MKKLRILLLSEQNNPNWISVPLVGYRHSEALAKLHDVHLVTHAMNQKDHEQYPGIFAEFTFINLGWLDSFYAWIFHKIFKGDFGSQALTAIRLPFYLVFEAIAWQKLKSRIKSGHYDCVLRLTPVAPVLPSPWAFWLKSTGVPFIIGPINGGLPFPPGFQQAERQREWISGLRSVYRSIPFARSTYAKAAAIVCGSSQTCREFSAYKEKVFFIPENGISPNMLENQRKKSNLEGELRLLFVGRLVPYKACDLAIKGAADLLAAGRAHLTIVGDGPDRHSLEALVLQLGLTARVTFTGILPHKETMQYFLAADILLFPSIREFGGGVVFEALASATVPLVADYGGPGDIIRDDIGFKIPLSHEADALVFIKSTLQELDSNRSRLHSLSQAGQIYARETLTWDGKALLMTRILNWTLGVSQKPNDLILD